MDSIFSIAFLVGLLAASLRMATPLIFATMGELFNERSGVLNLGIEGTMLLGGLVAFLITRATDNLWLGVVCAGFSGSLLSIIMAFLAVTLGLNQLVCGLGITFLGTGLSFFIYRLVIGSPTVPPTVEPFSVLSIPILSQIPVIGPALFQHYALVYIAIVIVGLSAFFLYKTPWGLKIRTVGENPKAADTMGINVYHVRYWSLILGGFLIGIGGSFLSLAHFNMFLFGLVSGRGFISIALLIFGGWNPGRCLVGALLFGGIDAFQFRLQTLGFDIPYQIFLILPYVMTILALFFVARKAVAPAGLAIAYRRE